jgi:hypothetical protein
LIYAFNNKSPEQGDEKPYTYEHVVVPNGVCAQDKNALSTDSASIYKVLEEILTICHVHAHKDQPFKRYLLEKKKEFMRLQPRSQPRIQKRVMHVF